MKESILNYINALENYSDDKEEEDISIKHVTQTLREIVDVHEMQDHLTNVTDTVDEILDLYRECGKNLQELENRLLTLKKDGFDLLDKRRHGLVEILLDLLRIIKEISDKKEYLEDLFVRRNALTDEKDGDLNPFGEGRILVVRVTDD